MRKSKGEETTERSQDSVLTKENEPSPPGIEAREAARASALSQELHGEKLGDVSGCSDGRNRESKEGQWGWRVTGIYRREEGGAIRRRKKGRRKEKKRDGRGRGSWSTLVAGHNSNSHHTFCKLSCTTTVPCTAHL